MTVVNGLLDRVFDLLLAPLRTVSPFSALTIVSLVTAIALLLVVRATSNQAAIAAAKRQIHADLFEIRLFNDDLLAILRAQMSILRHNATYVGLSLVPMLWTIVPLAVVISQLEAHFEYSGVEIGHSVLVTAEWNSQDASQRVDDPVFDPSIALETDQALTIQTPAVWFPALRQAVWKVVAEAPGDHVMRLRAGGQTYVKTLHASDGLARRSVERPRKDWLAEFWYPSEAPLPASSPIAFIRVAYPESRFEFLGHSVSWLGIYIALSLVFAFILRAPLGVTL